MKSKLSISLKAKTWIALLSSLFGLGIVLDFVIIEQPSIIRWETHDLIIGLFIGIKWSLLIAFLSMLIATITGISLGLIAGYFQNSTYKVSKLRIIWITITVFCCCFYGVYINTTFQSPVGYEILATMLFIIVISRLLWLPTENLLALSVILFYPLIA